MTQPVELTQRDIERDLERGLPFLRSLSVVQGISRILMQAGYTPEAHSEGWSMLLALMGYTPDASSLDVSSAAQAKAIAELDQWDGPHFARARAALEHLHPDQAAYIFSSLVQAEGAAAVSSVKTFCDRAAALRDASDPARTGTREEDKAAIQTLADRQIFNPEIEAHLRELIQQATSLDTEPSTVEDTTATNDYQQTAQRFHAWLTDWRETARVVITRRDYLIRLGLSARRPRKAAEPVG